jgi:glycyl-tRNA synthetase
MRWHRALGLDEARLHFHQHTPQELAHYARAAFDIQFDFGGTLGFQEIEGVHHRGDFDLGRHQEYSGKKLEYIDQVTNRRFVPFVIETSVGADRVTLAAIVNAYREEEVPGEQEGRVVLRLHPAIAPIKAGVFPLVKKDGMPEFADKLAHDLRRHFPVFYDDSGAIGRRYRRQDEVGTPFGITVDGQTSADGTVTLRDRDTLQQERVAADRVREVIAERIAAE